MITISCRLAEKNLAMNFALEMQSSIRQLITFSISHSLTNFPAHQPISQMSDLLPRVTPYYSHTPTYRPGSSFENVNMQLTLMSYGGGWAVISLNENETLRHLPKTGKIKPKSTRRDLRNGAGQGELETETDFAREYY